MLLFSFVHLNVSVLVCTMSARLSAFILVSCVSHCFCYDFLLGGGEGRRRTVRNDQGLEIEFIAGCCLVGLFLSEA